MTAPRQPHRPLVELPNLNVPTMAPAGTRRAHNVIDVPREVSRVDYLSVMPGLPMQLGTE